MIHKTSENLRNEIAVLDDATGRYDDRLRFTYDPVEDGHFYLKM